MPLTKHNTKKEISFSVLISSSPPSILLPRAIVGSSTSIRIPIISSTTNTPKTKSVNRCFFTLRSSKALMIIVVDDIEIMLPRKKLSIVDQPSKIPVLYPK